MRGHVRYLGIVKRGFGVLAALALVQSAALAANAERVVYSFTGGNDGGDPAATVVFDGAGNGYGTSVVGGPAGCGTVFELKPAAHGTWQETVLYAFSCGSDGKNPYGGLAFDAAGNAYGTTVAGGSGGACAGDGCGTVFELNPSGEHVLHNFTGNKDGFGPGGALVFDKNGNMFGTTPDGGAHGMGTVFELSPSGSTWQYRVIHSFSGGKDGATGSLGTLLVDAGGNLYGVTEGGGANSAGTAYELSPSRAGWKLTTLYAFKGQPDAGFPYGGLIADKNGRLYGTTYYGGVDGAGTVFALTPGKKHAWTESVLYSFTGGADGGSPTSTLVFDAAGNLDGTASGGGDPGCLCGTIFRLTAGSWQEHVMHTFGSGFDGAYPYYGLVAGPKGLYYATTAAGGRQNQGSIFSIKL